MTHGKLITILWAFFLAGVGSAGAHCPGASVTFEVLGMQKTASGAT